MVARLITVFLNLSVCLHCVSAVAFPDWCVLPPTVHIRQNETCKTLADIASRKIVWEGMRGEEEGRQILLDLEPWPAEYNLSVSFSIAPGDFVSQSGQLQRGKIDASIISWWQVGYVYCKETTRYAGSGGGWRPDPLLSPAENNSILLESGVSQPIWLSVSIPYRVPSDLYSGLLELQLTSSHFGTLSQAVLVELTVWDIDLPLLKEAKFPAIFSFNPGNLDVVYKKEAEAVEYKFYDLFLSQRVGGDNLYTTVPTNITTAAYLASKGVEWLSLYDVYGAAGVTEPGLHRVTGACVNFTDAMVQKVLDLLTPVVADYQAKGILGNMFVYGFDETPASCEASIRKIFGAIKQKWPVIRTVAVLNWLPPTDLPLDVWVLQYELYNKTQASTWTAAGKQQWWYHCIEPSGPTYLNSFIERPLMEARLLYWLGSAHQVGGWLYYSDVMWKRHPASSAPMQRIDGTARTDFDPANYIWLPRTDIFANGDGNFVYPGASGPIPTIRLHNLRDGFEDAELFRMLDLKQVGFVVEPLVRSPTNYTLDPALLEKMRRVAATLVQGTAEEYDV